MSYSITKSKGTSMTGKVSRSTSSMYGKLDPAGSNNCLGQEDLLKTLYSTVGFTLNTLLQNYSVGNILAVKNELTFDRYNQLSVIFRTNSKPDFLYYEIVRLLFNKVLDGLMRSIRQYQDLLDTVSKLEKCNEFKAILDDPVKLNEYIESLKKRVYLFEAEPITMVKGMLKPQYTAYIKLYGFPEGGIFDSNKLGEILYKLNNNIPINLEG